MSEATASPDVEALTAKDDWTAPMNKQTTAEEASSQAGTAQPAQIFERFAG